MSQALYYPKLIETKVRAAHADALSPLSSRNEIDADTLRVPRAVPSVRTVVLPGYICSNSQAVKGQSRQTAEGHGPES
jgi:hypothetical protein